jgi:type I restriction enzyme, S subunit
VKLKSLELIIPSESCLKSFDFLIEPIAKQIINYSKQNKLLKEARDILLPRLMTGMIDVDDMAIDNVQESRRV